MSDSSTLREAAAGATENPGQSLSNYISRLQLEPLRTSDTFALYRAHSIDNRTLLAVVANDDLPSSRSAERLKREYRLASELDPEWALPPIAYGLYDQRPTLLLDDQGSEPLDQVMATHFRPPSDDLTRALRLACELTHAIRQMHDRGIIHKDISPANAVVDRNDHVRLTGFGFASRSASEKLVPSSVAGTFAYMAPEQTGRMNRSVDTRSDLYAAGVTLYELFTGTLPFIAHDATEWAHCHIARKPPPPNARAEDLPLPVCSIILKLLAKDPDDRYQTARGLENDLRRCLMEWLAQGRIEDFRLGQDDISDRLLVPEKLYGRDAAIDTLTAAANGVMNGGPSEFVLVSGYAGTGKSSLINELHRRIGPLRVFFATGKFDQYKRDIPYATFVQAFRGLVRQLLAKNDDELAAWRGELLSALEQNGQLMIGLIPELAMIIGDQPQAPPVDLQSTQARFHMVFRSLLRVFAKPKHPLVLFIDDLQWLDAATLDLLVRLVTDVELQHLLLIGAYRNDKVDETHPLIRTLDAIRLARPSITEVGLGALSTGDLAALLADSLGTNAQDVTSLAAIVGEKTAGNPFFSVQFVRELAGEGLLRFDPPSLRWIWDIPGILRKGMTDNVAHLIATRLERLSHQSRQALGNLALLGSAAHIQTISLVDGRSTDDTQAILRSAEEAGLVQCAHGIFSFVHDHVQEAAYAMVPVEERSQSHLRAGRLLLSQTSERELDSNIFEIVSQYDRGFSSISSNDDKRQAAELYLAAGQRAKAAGAFASARSYFSRGRQLLGEEDWTSQHRLVFEFELNQAECEIVAGEFDAAEARLTTLGANIEAPADRADVACLAILLYFTLGRSERAVEVGLDFLLKEGAGWPVRPYDAAVRREYDDMRRRLAEQPVETLIDLPEMREPTIIATMAVLTELFPAAYAIDRHLMELVLLRMINLSLEYGNCASSSVAYSALNMAIGSSFGDYQTAFSLGELALRLVHRRNSDRYKARVYSCFAAFAMPWITHISSARPLTTQAFQISSSMGDMAFAAYNLRNHITHLLMSGAPLSQVQQEAARASTYARNVQLGLPVERFFGQLQLVHKLLAEVSDLTEDDGKWALEGIEGPPGLAMMACYHWVFKLEQYYFEGDLPAALRAAEHLNGRLWAMRSSIEEAEYEFFAGLAKSAAGTSAASEERQGYTDALAVHRERFAVWAEHAPENFGCRKALLDAELARLQGQERRAQNLYEEAIRLARTHGFLQIEALANELAFNFYSTLNLSTVSNTYLRRAHACYEKWGCLIKIRQLELRYPHLRRRRSPEFSTTTADVPIANLDVQVVDRASRTLSSEMDLTNLIEKLMRLAIEHAGAERGSLLLLSGSELTIEATATTVEGAVDVQVLARKPVESDLPHAAVQYAIRTRAPLVLDSNTPTDLDGLDEYMRANRPRSILCLPILKAADVVGLLYLENRMIARAFTSERVAVLDFLASQAAIWLENARLYSDLQRSEAWLREAQRLSLTGSFYWNVLTDDLEFSEQLYRICQIDAGQRMAIKHLESIVHPGDAEAFRDVIELARKSGTDINHKFRLQIPTLSVRHVHLVAHGGRTRDGQFRYIGAVQDVTSQHFAQEALGRARSELARVARATTLGVLTASIAHEVNQPLLGIVTNATTCLRMLAAQPPNIEGARKTAQRSVRDGHRAADMIRRLRRLFGEGGTVNEPIDANDAAREVISLVIGELQGNQIILDTRLAEDLPKVSADRVQIQQVIMNLILNASDAMREVYDRPRKLVLSTQLVGHSVRLHVKDSGTGFDAQAAGELFEAFYTTKTDGLGMGLSISRSIVESHRGHVWATLNDDGPGATFSFSLPADPIDSLRSTNPALAGRSDEISLRSMDLQQ